MLRRMPVVLAATALLPAMESRLHLAPDDLHGSISLLSEFVERGAQRHDDLALQGRFVGRIQGFGAQLEVVTALDRNDADTIDALDIIHLGVGLDYLYEIPDYVQLRPHFEIDSRPYLDNDEEALWVGLDAWYLTPVEGLEFGANVDSDLDDNYGTGATLGARQFYQQAPLDLLTWQMLNFGDDDYAAYTGGAPDGGGLTTFELGVESVLPLPFQYSWLKASFELHYWITDDNQDYRGDDALESMFAIGVEWRGE